MPDYSSQIEKLSKELNRFIKNPTHYPDDEIEEWVDQHLFEDNFVKQNLSLNLIWIFSKNRVLSNHKDVKAVCSWLYQNLKLNLDSKNFDLVSGFTIVALEWLTSKLNELPSIKSCLTNFERESVIIKMRQLKVDDRVLNFKDSPQYKQLLKLESIPIVSSFLENYDQLLEIATGESDHGSLDQILQYILTVNDVIPDSMGVLGLVDDLYVLEQLSIQSEIVEGDSSTIKWMFNLNFPDFQFPIIIDNAGNNLISKVDSLIKTALYFDENSSFKPKVFFLDESGPFCILASLLGSISTLKLKDKESFISTEETLQIGKTYVLSNGSESINLIFKSVYQDSHFLFGGFNRYGEGWSSALTKKELNKCKIDITDEEPNSQEAKFSKFKKNLSKNIHGMFPFGLANNLNVAFEKVFIVDRKKNLDGYLNTEIEGRSIEEWFGRRAINTQGKESISHGLLSSEPLITTAYNLDSLMIYLSENDFSENKFHSLNLISSGSLDNDIEQLSRLSNKFNQSFKTLNVFSDQNNEYAEDLFKDANYQIFKEHRNLATTYVHPPKNSLFENYLSKVGAYPNIELLAVEEPLLEEFFQISNFTLSKQYIVLKNLLFSVKRIFLSRYAQLSTTAKEQLEIKLDDYIARLKSYVHVHENIEYIILFLETNREFVLEFERSTFVYEHFAENENTKILVSGKEYESVRKKGWEKNHITKTDMKQLTQTETLVVPAFIDRKITKNLINFPFAEKIIFIASKYEIENYLRHLVEDRVKVEVSEEEVPKSEVETDIDAFEKIFIDIDLGSISSTSRSVENTGQLYESRLFLLDNNTCLSLPKNGRQIITHDLINLLPEEIPVKNIDPGDFLIIPDTQNASLQDSILDLTVKNINEIREKASLWKHMLADALNLGTISFDDIQTALIHADEKRHLQTILNWFRNPQLIAPQQSEKVFLVFTQILGLESNALDECLANTKVLYRERNKIMDNLAEYLRSATYDEVKNTLELKINNHQFIANIYEALTFQDTSVTFDELYRIKNLEDHFDGS